MLIGKEIRIFFSKEHFLGTCPPRRLYSDQLDERLAVSLYSSLFGQSFTSGGIKETKELFQD